MIYVTGNEPINPIFGESGYCSTLDVINDNDAKGLTLRQYYAGLAMQSLCHQFDTSKKLDDAFEVAAKWSLKIADALIKELNKPQQ